MSISKAEPQELLAASQDVAVMMVTAVVMVLGAGC